LIPYAHGNRVCFCGSGWMVGMYVSSLIV
jgi:hypothetical protein